MAELNNVAKAAVEAGEKIVSATARLEAERTAQLAQQAECSMPGKKGACNAR